LLRAARRLERDSRLPFSPDELDEEELDEELEEELDEELEEELEEELDELLLSDSTVDACNTN